MSPFRDRLASNDNSIINRFFFSGNTLPSLSQEGLNPEQPQQQRNRLFLVEFIEKEFHSFSFYRFFFFPGVPRDNHFFTSFKKHRTEIPTTTKKSTNQQKEKRHRRYLANTTCLLYYISDVCLLRHASAARLSYLPVRITLISYTFWPF